MAARKMMAAKGERVYWQTVDWAHQGRYFCPDLSCLVIFRSSSRASPLPQGNAFQMWEQACSR
ncbi:hypothetical protein SAMN04489798_3937 [Pseudomonas arsenicoxydans]|uniref:Uncharacterized protein n=1 Tax=Pseudomonas arsenicoxydans TaxID=702115 RepID=A0A1H0MMW3_9PSED|nr:hypothetical protein SAMN04489798_3937 [Pseudomonas arsenicoxydans]